MALTSYSGTRLAIDMNELLGHQIQLRSLISPLISMADSQAVVSHWPHRAFDGCAVVVIQYIQRVLGCSWSRGQGVNRVHWNH